MPFLQYVEVIKVYSGFSMLTVVSIRIMKRGSSEMNLSEWEGKKK